jgi:hypothetical protein
LVLKLPNITLANLQVPPVDGSPFEAVPLSEKQSARISIPIGIVAVYDEKKTRLRCLVILSLRAPANPLEFEQRARLQMRA